MEKRVIVAVVLCVAILFFWAKLFPPPAPPPQVAPATPVTAPAEQKGAPAAPAAPAPSTGGTGSAAPAVEPGKAAALRPEEKVELVTPNVRFVFSSFGGTLKHAQLREEKFQLRKGDPSSGQDLIRTTDAKHAPLRTTFPESGFPAIVDGSWEVMRPAPDTVVFRAENAAVVVEKRYRADTTRYRLHLEVTVHNKSAKSHDHHLAIHVYGRQDPENKGGGIFSGPSANMASILCHVNEETERNEFEGLIKEPLEKVGAVRWVAADEKFLVLAAVPYPESPPRERKCSAKSTDGEVGEAVLTFAGRTVAPQASTTYPFTIFAGPKVISELEAVQPGGQDPKLSEAVDVTLAVLSRPLLSLLKFFQTFVKNWGVAIILLTIFIKLVTFYPTQRALLSAKKMQKLAPKMAAIRKKYEGDRQRQSAETMNLYKAQGVSPFGGCLPSLIQMPIWIALYSTLNYAVELYRSPFALHIHDLTAKDPYYVTPLVMGGVMYLQMKMSPASPDAQQQAMMTVMMPVMFTAFSLVLPSGLALYMLTSYLIGILQQLYVNYLDKKSSPATA
jgi:YidC/Oxa1 family membrane protein insertase